MGQKKRNPNAYEKAANQAATPAKRTARSYARFEEINGTHPWRKAVPKGYVDYEVRRRKGGKVLWFNFDLAREMGLVDEKHPIELNKELEEKILDTFALRVINEYDLKHKKPYPDSVKKEHKYMATRYLQLQHKCKRGTTSGDGRSIWNGCITHKGVTFDVSSCGTGVTRLSPGAVKAKKPIETGSGESYGSGLAGIDEGLSSAILSEIYYRKGLGTERVLAVLEFAKGVGITIRAQKNLIRPSHLFNHLKQENYEDLKGGLDHFIARQNQNENWGIRGRGKYDRLLEKLSEVYAEFAARLEDEYIFCWLDWDGDNMLATGGIIDYGSIRQFGLFHHRYRYDDVDRYSTTILEQKNKAKETVQTFAQLVDYLKTGKKKRLNTFAKHKSMRDFDKHFEHFKNRNLLIKMGMGPKEIRKLLKDHVEDVRLFRKSFRYFEQAMTKEGMHEVADGINCSPIFCMRDGLRELPRRYFQDYQPMDEAALIEIMRSNYAKDEDLEITNKRAAKIEEFQENYLNIFSLVAGRKGRKKLLLEMMMRASVINQYHCVTGDAIIHVVDSILEMRKEISQNSLIRVVRHFIERQSLETAAANSKTTLSTKKQRKLLRDVIQLINDHRHSI